MGRGAFDTSPPFFKKPVFGIRYHFLSIRGVEESKVDRIIQGERGRRSLWHHQFGFDGARASMAEREAEERRKEVFQNQIKAMERKQLPPPKPK